MNVSHPTPSETILPILVLYNCALQASGTYRTFIASAHNVSPDRALIAVYDNSQLRQVSRAEEGHLFAYKHDPRNSGIAAAYNWALDLAQSSGFSWLLLLDQDTELPMEFIESLVTQVRQYDSSPNIVALVPVVHCGGRIVSPKRVGCFGLRPLPAASAGVLTAEIMAVNSGAAIRCDFVRSIHGFNRAYWLDFLDHWLFRQVYAAGRKAAVSKCILEHTLSVQDYRHGVSTARYRSILAGEAGFITAHKPKTLIPLYLFRLVVRSLKLMTLQRLDLAHLTIATLFRIITHPTRSLEGSSS